ncbi:TIGR02677 family protein [Listeria rustica]|uniref:TIGR02677 family protein n=1 Tax=Listeria rustica TaxID=2713503 RepID=A0A7W1T5E5_9LIST|nr:TIGR02677 family protein [Listeria rustica]MBA3925841.1 TIGR02677 family protein [Listeria rustica]
MLKFKKTVGDGMGRISKNLEDYRKISEASYLVADQNVHRYRIILRYFFVEHERMRDYLYPNDILWHVRSVEGMEEYKDAELEQDLAALVRWGNITPRQEVRNPKTIMEFNKKSFRYQIAPYTVQIERMLAGLEQSGDEFQGSLDKRPFEKVLLALRAFLSRDDVPILEKWQDMIDLFSTIRTNTADYLAYVSSANAEENMQKDNFLVYKDRFVSYLRDFIVGSHQTALKIQAILLDLDRDELDRIFDEISQKPDFAPRFEEIVPNVEEKKEELFEIWDSFVMWFLDRDGNLCEYSILQARTDDTIKKITRNIKRLGERHQQHISRKRDYLHIAKWFAEEADIGRAHELSAIVFGLPEVRHYVVTPETGSTAYREIWETEPDWKLLKPRVQGYRERTKPTSFTLNTEEKEAAKEAYLQALKNTEAKMLGYVRDGEIDLSVLTYVDTSVRKVLLGWVSQAMLEESKVVLTEFGNRVRVRVDESERIKIESDDGVMKIPKITFTFEDGDIDVNEG